MNSPRWFAATGSGGYSAGMDEKPDNAGTGENPYRAPKLDPDTDLQIRRRQRKLTNFVLTIGLSVVLFVAYWGIRILFWALNRWLFRS